MEFSSQDRNLPASERKLEKAREDGQVTRSKDLSNIAVLGVGSVGVLSLSPLLFGQLKTQISQQLSFDARVMADQASMLRRLNDMVSVGLLGCVVFALLVSAAAILSTVAAGGWVSSLKPIMPDFSRVNPLAGFGRMFTKDKLSEVVKMSFITVVLIALGAVYLSASLDAIAMLVLQPSTAALEHLSTWLTRGLGILLLVVLLVAMVDVPLQMFLHKSRLKMSHQEVKQEHKESDGNPQLKSKQRERQRKISQGNSIAAVPKADFVLMNPTHFAVAIRYDDKTMRAPQVVSKGADLLAMKIRDIAKHHAIPVLQSPMLARALYANAELDKDIPASLYIAVAQVLAYIYRLKAAMRGDGPMPGEPPQPFVPAELDPLSKVVANTVKP
ncbi:MAG: EscU/YscU/HrcU family type III secretion system export apparatus switch protein [Burkholderiales bacterium]|nr:EscU/YscU/HrcU family type III secretion system export apparatus switch protein [Burkholderiales bacterium]